MTYFDANPPPPPYTHTGLFDLAFVVSVAVAALEHAVAAALRASRVTVSREERELAAETEGGFGVGGAGGGAEAGGGFTTAELSIKMN